MRWYFGTAAYYSSVRPVRGPGIAHLEPGEARHGYVFAQLGDLRLDQVVDGGRIVFNEGLLVQADLFVEFVHAPFDDLIDHLFGLALIQSAGAMDVALLRQRLFGDVLLAEELRIGCSHLHGEVMHQLLKIVGARDEVGFAVHLDEYAQLGAGMNVAADHALFGGAGRFLCG